MNHPVLVLAFAAFIVIKLGILVVLLAGLVIGIAVVFNKSKS